MSCSGRTGGMERSSGFRRPLNCNGELRLDKTGSNDIIKKEMQSVDGESRLPGAVQREMGRCEHLTEQVSENHP